MERLVPRCSLRQTAEFLRDPAAFTAGPGLTLGDLYRVRVPGHRIHVVTDPSLVERILVRDADHFGKGKIYWRELRRAVGDAMGALDGERWEYLHAVQRPFFTPRAVETYHPIIAGHVTAFTERLERSRAGGRSTNRPQGRPREEDVGLLHELSALNARIVLSALFGQEESVELDGVVERVAEGNRILDWRSKYPWRPLLARFNGLGKRGREHQAFFDRFVARLRNRARQKPEHLLGALMAIGDDPGSPPFSPTLVRNEVAFHLGASTETAAAAESWALYLLWRHPEALGRLRTEVEEAAGGAEPTPDHLPALTFTRQVLSETLRLYPPVYGIVRDCREPLDLGPFSARRGDTFLISVYGLHRSPRIWDDPGRFHPGRFHPEAVGGIDRYAYIPFGAGRHACTGRHLAIPAMTLTVAQFAHRFDWTFEDPDIRAEATPSLKPAGPFRVQVMART